MEAVVVFCTVPTEETAKTMARTLVEERLAACISILPGIRSLYRWEDAICDDAELLLLIKTRRELFTLLSQRLQDIHPYQVPEILCLAVEQGAPAYLNWLWAETEFEPEND